MSDLITFFITHSEHFIYAALFFILFLCGLGLPVPEELTLLAGGFLINLEIIRPYPTLAVGFAGVITGDLVMYSIGRRWGNEILTYPRIRNLLPDKRLERVKQFFSDHGNKTIFVARFISGFRVAAFLGAGIMGMKPGQFILLDILGALILIPLLVFLGYYFAANIGWLGEIFTQIDTLLKILAVLGCICALGYYLYWRRKSAAR